MSDREVYGLRARSLTALRYMAVVAGAALVGWAMRPGPVGFAVGVGGGLMVLGFAVWLAKGITELAAPPVVRVSLDQDDFCRLIRGQEVGRPGGVRIALRDIGWTVMLAEIQRAFREAREGSDVL